MAVFCRAGFCLATMEDTRSWLRVSCAAPGLVLCLCMPNLNPVLAMKVMLTEIELSLFLIVAVVQAADRAQAFRE